MTTASSNALATLGLLAALCLLALGGCGAPQQPASEPHDETAPLACSGVCTVDQACARAGWACSCVEHPDVNCGGAPRPLGPSTWLWDCAPLEASADRGDGCPFAPPVDGTVCGLARECTYGEGPCGLSGVQARCAGGSWRVTAFALPPPP